MDTGRLHHQAAPNGSLKPSRRLRVLTCACTSLEASELLRSFSEAETMHIPSSDVPELGEELNRLHPDYVLCKTEFLLGLMPSSGLAGPPSRGIPPSPAQPESAAILMHSSDVSPRDLEVLQLLAKGARNADIAAALDLAESSVKRILQRLYERFEAANRAELLGRAMELNLFADLPPEPAQTARS